jgi:hypothetical protein
VPDAPAGTLRAAPVPEPAAPSLRERSTPNAENASPPAPSFQDGIRAMAAHLTGRLGREEAEQVARANAGWYERSSPEFLYWQRVADTIKGESRPTAGR